MGKASDIVVDGALYEDGVEYYGLVEATLPDVSFLTATVTGLGIAGNIEQVIIGMIDSMSASLKFRTATTEAAKLSSPYWHKLELWVAQQQHDAVESVDEVVNAKYVLVAMPKKLTLGTIKPASTSDPSAELAVKYLKYVLDGRVVCELDPRNHKCVINGVDYLADVRKALGKA